MKPDDVSEEAWEAATSIASDLPTRVRPDNRTFASTVIARAIMAAEKRASERERERCAKVCEAQKEGFLSPSYATNQPFGSLLERFACDECATAIREGGE